MAANPCFDFSGTRQFLKILAFLEVDLEPISAEWDLLFETPGYRTLLHEEFKRDFFIKNFRLAFMPSKAWELGEALKSTERTKIGYIEHYLRVKSMKDKILAQLRKLEETPLAEAVAAKASSFLPPAKCADLPGVSFLIFGNDARGYSRVVVDIVFSIEAESVLPLLLAHEFHHFYRNKILAFDPRLVGAEDKSIVWLMNQIQAEGIADQIDKPFWFYRENAVPSYQAFALKYREFVERSPKTIRAMDQLFCRMWESPRNKRGMGSKFLKIVPMSGHPTGFWMANTIQEELGREALIREVGNPFAFFRLYNQAAIKKRGVPSFSEEAMSLISSLAKRYVGGSLE